MIALSFIDSPDVDILDHFAFFKDSVVLMEARAKGASKSADLILQDEGLKELQLQLRVHGDQLIGIVSPTDHVYHVNGKITKGLKYLKENDQIRIGQTTLQILKYGSSVTPLEALIKNKLAQPADPRLATLEEILISDLKEANHQLK